MRKIFSATMTIGLLAVEAAGCHQSGNDIAGSVCQKAGGCDSLSGITTDQCKNVVNNSLQSMTSAGRSAAENALNGCLAMTDCASFSTCINTVLTGGSATGGSTGSGGTMIGTGGSALGGSGGSATGGLRQRRQRDRWVGSAAAAARRRAARQRRQRDRWPAAAAARPAAAAAARPAGLPAPAASRARVARRRAAASTAPELMTSGPSAYWKTAGQVTKVTSGTADLNVDKNTKYQRWDGFGGTFNEMGWDALSVVSCRDTERDEAPLRRARTAPISSIGRIPLGASDYAMSWYTLDDTAGDYTMAKFSIARDQQKLIPFIKAALKVKSDIHLWASPWVVPSWMMDSSSNMKSDAQTRGAHALYMAKFVEEYAKEGLTIEAIHPQNEPGYARVHWTQVAA